MKTALIIGSTGLVGSALLNELLAHPAYSKVISFTRKPSAMRTQNYTNIASTLITLPLTKT